jgi:hypothetical protein
VVVVCVGASPTQRGPAKKGEMYSLFEVGYDAKYN